MSQLPETKIAEIKAMVEQEYPNDFALQQVHIARKILAEEAKQRGLTFIEYIRSLKTQLVP